MIPRPRTGSTSLLLLGLVALVLLAAPRAARAGTDVGVNVASLMMNPALSTGSGPLLRRAHDAGFAHVRLDAAWPWNEPDAPRTVTSGGAIPPLLGGPPATTTRVHDYRWDFTDRMVDDLAAHGLRWQPVLAYTPRWAQSVRFDSHSRPQNIDDFAAWAGRFAARYGTRGTHAGPYPVRRYEIWNEPNFPYFFAPSPDPAFYAALFMATARAIRAADPSAIVVTGGLAMNAPAQFLEAGAAAVPAFRQGAIGEIGLHPYGRDVPRVVDAVRRTRRELTRFGFGPRPLSLGEVGWRALDHRSDRGALPDRTRAGNLALVTDALAHSDCGISTIEAYTWVSTERNPNYGNDWWGIMHPNGRLRASARAFSAAARRAGTPRPVVPICSGHRTAHPLRLGLRARSRTARCRRYVVTYAGYPVNGIPVGGTDARRRRLRTARSDANGRLRLCGSRRGRLRVRATIGTWARSGWVRR